MSNETPTPLWQLIEARVASVAAGSLPPAEGLNYLQVVYPEMPPNAAAGACAIAILPSVRDDVQIAAQAFSMMRLCILEILERHKGIQQGLESFQKLVILSPTVSTQLERDTEDALNWLIEATSLEDLLAEHPQLVSQAEDLCQTQLKEFPRETKALLAMCDRAENPQLKRLFADFDTGQDLPVSFAKITRALRRHPELHRLDPVRSAVFEAADRLSLDPNELEQLKGLPDECDAEEIRDAADQAMGASDAHERGVLFFGRLHSSAGTRI